MKRYTIMFFSSDRMGKMRTITVSRAFIAGFALFMVAVFAALTISIVHLNKLRTERDNMLAFNNENSALKKQISSYSQQLEDISKKLSAIDDLEYKVRDIVSLQKGTVPLKPIAVGGREVDLLRDFSVISSVKEGDFFDNLNTSLDVLSTELEKSEMTLSDLASVLESQRSIMLYTPTTWPVKGWVSSNYGYRISPFSGRQVFHEGVDISARFGSDVAATAKGIVIFAGPKAGLGNLVTIDHGYGYITRYAHNSRITVKVGDKVDKGDVIGKVGTSGDSTGAHVHYEVLVNGIPVNPTKFIIEDI